jgi:drug/metabolite transporter (DMT)-like permease
MLAIVLALVSALAYGVSDYAAGLASRDFSVIQVTLVSAAASTLVVVAVLPFAAAHPPGAAPLAWGALAGLGEEVGALALYHGFRHAEFSVAGPLSAVGAAGFAVIAGLLLGERPSGLALTGIILALPAIVGVSASAAADQGKGAEGAGAGGAGAEGSGAGGARAGGARAGGAGAGGAGAGGAGAGQTGGGRARGRFTGVVAGLVAGACFSLLFIGLNQAGSRSGLWPVASASGAELATAVAVAAATRNMRWPAAHQGRLAVFTGVTGAGGIIAYFFATHDGFLAVTAVLTSLYPAVTIVLARVLLGEKLTALRLTGLGLATACVALIAAGGAG